MRIFNPPLTGELALCKVFVGLGKTGLGCLCFSYHPMFCRYKGICLRLERSECPQLLCNPRNEDRNPDSQSLLPAFQRAMREKHSQGCGSFSSMSVQPSSSSCCPGRDGISPHAMKHLHVTELCPNFKTAPLPLNSWMRSWNPALCRVLACPLPGG